MKIAFKGHLYEATKKPRVWYHGTSVDFNKFEYQYAYISEKSHALNGPGFYLTDNLETAAQYAGSNGFIKEVTLKKLTNIKSYKAKFTSQWVKWFIDHAPNLEMVLTDWGENPAKAKIKLLNSMIQYSDNLGEVINNIWTDVYRNHEDKLCEFLAINGKIDGVMFPHYNDYQMLVAYNPDNLIITKTIKPSEIDSTINESFDYNNPIKGGVGDNTHPNKEALDKGISVEKEHVGNVTDKKKKAIAADIAKDHLVEFPKYYDALEKMEDNLRKPKRN